MREERGERRGGRGGGGEVRCPSLTYRKRGSSLAWGFEKVECGGEGRRREGRTQRERERERERERRDVHSPIKKHNHARGEEEAAYISQNAVLAPDFPKSVYSLESITSSQHSVPALIRTSM